MSSLTKFTANVSNHQSQPDQPALTSAELKQLFDKAPEDIKEYLNVTLLPELEEIINKMTSTTEFLTDSKQNKIQVGTTIPTELEEGELYIQVF